MKFKLVVIILSFWILKPVRATSWNVNCKPNEVAVSDGVDTMSSPPICKSRKELEEAYEKKCEKGDLEACEGRWHIENDKSKSLILKNQYIEKSKTVCEAGKTWACQEIWRVISNDTYPPLPDDVVKKYHSGKTLRTRDEQVMITKYIGLACKKAWFFNLNKSYYCQMANYEEKTLVEKYPSK